MLRIFVSFLAISAMLLPAPTMSQVATDSTAESRAATLNELKFEFHIARAELIAPLKELDKLYLAQLEKLEQQAQDRGALEEIIAVRAERARVERRPPEREGTDFPELVKVRDIYEKSKAQRTYLMHQRLFPVIEHYKGQLEALRTEQTKQNLLDAAILTNKQLSEVTSLETAMREARENPGTVEASPAYPGLGGNAAAHALKVKVQVDGITHLFLRDGEVWFDHSKGRASPPGRHQGNFPTLLNDKTSWMPRWNGAVTQPFAVGFGFPEKGDTKIHLRISAGRGTAEVIQQPSDQNDHIAIVELRDQREDGTDFFGSDWLEFRLSW